MANRPQESGGIMGMLMMCLVGGGFCGAAGLLFCFFVVARAIPDSRAEETAAKIVVVAAGVIGFLIGTILGAVLWKKSRQSE